jgi:hypothetical protein
VQGDDAHSGGSGSSHAGRGIFEDQTVTGSDAQERGAFQIGLGRGLALQYVIGRDHVAGKRESRVSQAGHSQRARGRGNNSE